MAPWNEIDLPTSAFELPRQLLLAAATMVRCKREVAPLLARQLGLTSESLFYNWCQRSFAQRGDFCDGRWRYFFHGYECDLNHIDGRSIRIEFGPGGRIDTFTTWGLAVFLAHTRDPWPQFPRLRDLVPAATLATQLVSQLSHICDPLLESLESHGLVETVDPELLVWAAAHTHKNEEGLNVFTPPPDAPLTKHFDSAVAMRKCIAAAGWQVAETQH